MNLRDWQARHGFTYDTAAEALGVSRRTYARMLKRGVLPTLVLLAMARIDDEKKWMKYENGADDLCIDDMPMPEVCWCKLSCTELLNSVRRIKEEKK